MNQARRERWEQYYQSLEADSLPKPAAVLAEHVHLLPGHGTALDMACGRGGNALYLAAHGLETSAWDYADAAIDRLRHTAADCHLPIECAVRDVCQQPPEADTFDVIVISHFLDRNLTPQIMRALKPGGLLFYQTFVRDKPGTSGPSNPDFLLKPNELLRLFADMQVCFYREDGRVGSLDQGLRDEAQFIGQKKTQ